MKWINRDYLMAQWNWMYKDISPEPSWLDVTCPREGYPNLPSSADMFFNNTSLVRVVGDEWRAPREGRDAAVVEDNAGAANLGCWWKVATPAAFGRDEPSVAPLGMFPTGALLVTWRWSFPLGQRGAGGGALSISWIKMGFAWNFLVRWAE